jgi:hypothetical protein
MNETISTAQWYKVMVPAAERNSRGKTIQNDFETLYSINGPPNGSVYSHVQRQRPIVIPCTFHREQLPLLAG